VELAEKLQPDLVVMDVTMPELNGVEAARRIRKASAQTEVLILTMHESDELVQQVVETGARGYILKDDADKILLAAVDAVRQHKPYFSTRVSSSHDAVNSSADTVRASRSRLTPREREIVQLLAEGKSNKEVASLLGISVNTAEAHRANIMLKLDLHSVTELVHYAIRNNIVKT
jgi:DNA-binding NarL/FixJ family response regulator